MPVSFVAAGSVATASSNSLTIAAPNGLTGDLLVFIIIHDDFSDGSSNLGATGTPPVAVTQIHNGGGNSNIVPMANMDDSKCYVFYCVHDQDTGENWTFGTLTATEELKGVCLRFRGQHASTPIDETSGRTNYERSLLFFPPTHASEWGAMFVGVRWDDGAPGTQTPPTGWDERVDSSATNNSLYVATRPAQTYPFPSFFPTAFAASGDEMGSLAFTILPAASTTYTVAGVTYDADGEILGSCQVSLFRHRGSGVFEYVDTQVSNASTGAYSFTVPEDSANFMAVAHKSGSPNVFDVTDLNLDPA